MTVTTEMAQKVGSRPIIRVQITTSGGTTDISSYFKSCNTLDMEKSRTGELALVSSGDMVFVFSNHNDYFTELDTDSIFYGVTYLGYNIDIDYGFRKDDGTTEYVDQAILKVTDVTLNSDGSECFISARDNISRLNGFILNVPANAIVPIADAGNDGNGYVTEIQTIPFGTVSENWTLTCTTGGGSGVGEFSVVGSVSGNIGTATSNTEFSTGSIIKFTILAGGTAWSLGDIFTFTTRQNIEWASKSPAKIIWSILTGYNYDTDTAEAWLLSTPQLDHTQGAGNTDIDYASFQTAVANLGVSFNLTGYIRTNSNCSTVISDIIVHFLGTIYVNSVGKIYIKTYAPSLGEAAPTEFSSSNKITFLKYNRSLDNVINSATAKYKKTATWAWSGAVETTDGTYTKTNTSSITMYGEKTHTIETFWISISNFAIQWAVDRLVDKYANPPLILNLTTGTDALQVGLGGIIQVTDTKTQLNKKTLEIDKLSKDFSSKPTHIEIECSDTGTASWNWAYCGSKVNESDYDWSKFGNIFWSSIAVDSDASVQAMVSQLGEYNPPAFNTPVPIYVSVDSGVSWNIKDSARAWNDICMSSDGARQTAVDYGGYIYISTDSGATWTAKDSIRG